MNEHLGIFEELQERRLLIDKHRKRIKRLGPADNGAYAQPANPFRLRLQLIGQPYHKDRADWRGRQDRPRYQEGELGLDIDHVVQAVSLAGKVRICDLFSSSKKRTLTLPRHVAVWTIDRYCPGYSLTQLGRLFRQDHSSISYGIQEINRRLEAHDDAVRVLVSKVRQRLHTIWLAS